MNRIIAGSFVKRVEHRVSLASTNDFALELAREGELAVPLLVVADEQTAGRGRGANQWWSGQGGLACSLILEPLSMGLSQDRWPRIALTAGLSVCEVLERLLPGVPCTLKWPNDVLLEGRKVSGILLETAAPPGLPRWPEGFCTSGVGACAPGFPSRLVLGIGMNVNNSLSAAPADVRLRATSLFETAGQTFAVADILLELLGRLEVNLRALAAGDPKLPQAWQARCALIGREVEVDPGPGRVCGVCRGLDAEGALLIDTDRGRKRLFGGTVRWIE